MRINQFLARAGYGSRRACEEIILDGQVFINGQRVTKLAVRVGPNDSVSIAGKKIHAERPLTAMLYKPRGYLCSTVEEGGAKTIFELLPREWPRVFYIGRLDMDSEGLLLLTNNGDLAQRMSHPSFKLPKIYEVRLNRDFDFEADTDKLRNGMLVEGKIGRFDAIHKLAPHLYKVVLSQGLKRQIRLMFEYIGYTVERLVRTQIGSLTLGNLSPGQWKIIHESEVEKLFKLDPDAAAAAESTSGDLQHVPHPRPPRRPRPYDGPRSGGDRPGRPSYPRRERDPRSERPSFPRRENDGDRDEQRSERSYPVSRPGGPGGSRPPRRPFAARGPGSATDSRTGYAYPKRHSPYGGKGAHDQRPGGIPRRFGPPSPGGQAGPGRKTYSGGAQGSAGRRGPRPGGPGQGPRPGGRSFGPRRGH